MTGRGMGGRGPGGRQRVRTAKGRTVASQRWLERQLNDPYVRRARAEGYRSRAAYKLIELDERFGFLKGASRVVDLGIAPGGWAQVVRKARPRAVVAGIDLLPVDPIDGVAILQLDFLADEAPALLADALGGPADLVLSDMAANTVGHQQTDHLRTMALVEAAALFAGEVLAPGGAFVAKVLAGGADNALVARLKRDFATVKHAKPPASRKESSEWYVVAQGFKGRGAQEPPPLRRRSAGHAGKEFVMSVDVKYRTTAVATGGRDGEARAEDGRFSARLSTPKELGGAGGDGTNPEQLFAAGYSACFIGALKVAGQQLKLKVPDDVSVTGTVGIGPRSEGGFGITADLRVSLPGLDRDEARRLIDTAHQICPYSNATRGNVDVGLTLA